MTQLILPNAGLGLSVALIESSILPFLANLVDVRHTAAFGKVFAIADTSFCLSYCLGMNLFWNCLIQMDTARKNMRRSLTRISHFQDQHSADSSLKFLVSNGPYG